jgi:hypothetical protein
MDVDEEEEATEDIRERKREVGDECESDLRYGPEE